PPSTPRSPAGPAPLATPRAAPAAGASSHDPPTWRACTADGSRRPGTRGGRGPARSPPLPPRLRPPSPPPASRPPATPPPGPRPPRGVPAGREMRDGEALVRLRLRAAVAAARAPQPHPVLELRPHQQFGVHIPGVHQVVARQQALGRQRRVDRPRLVHVC